MISLSVSGFLWPLQVVGTLHLLLIRLSCWLEYRCQRPHGVSAHSDNYSQVTLKSLEHSIFSQLVNSEFEKLECCCCLPLELS
jgi:hypothetical protein